MGFYSCKDFERALDSGEIRIDSPKGIKISEASVDVGLGNLYFKDPLARYETSPFKEETFQEYKNQFCKPLEFDGGYEVLPHRQTWIAESEETVMIPNNILKEVSSRSSAARMFLKVDNADDDFRAPRSCNRKKAYTGKVPMLFHTFGPGIKLYKGDRYAQLFLHDLEGFLYGNGLKNALKRGEVKTAKNGKSAKEILLYRDGDAACGIMLTLGEDIKLLKGSKIFDPKKDCSNYFEDFTLPHHSNVRFPKGTVFLASTAEKVGLSENYIGHLHDTFKPSFPSTLMVHPNAPYHNPGANGTLVLECHAYTDVGLKAGMPIVRMDIYRMNSPAEYCGRYAGQNGIIESRAHLGL